MRKALTTRLARLEQRAAIQYRHAGESPRCAGKPRHVAIIEYVDWLESRLAHEPFSDAKRCALLNQITRYRQVAAELAAEVAVAPRSCVSRGNSRSS